jgi:hypothetical protein
MKRTTTIWKAALLIPAFLFLMGMQSIAQVDLPRPSPKASVMQTVGLTEISVTYSSPGVKDRMVWGGLVPYGEVWRTGANEATLVTFSSDVKVEGMVVPAGKYAFYAIPGKDEWQVMLNSNWDTWGTDGYEEANNVVSVKIRPEKVKESKERLAYHLDYISDDEAMIVLRWEMIRLPIRVSVSTMDQAMKGIEKSLAEMDRKWIVLAQSARYVMSNGGDEVKAMAWMDESLKLNDASYYNKMIMAELLASKGNYAKAIQYGEAAIKAGDADPNNSYTNFYKGQIQKNLAEWKKK